MSLIMVTLKNYDKLKLILFFIQNKYEIILKKQ